VPSAIAIGAFAYQTIWVVSVTFAVWFALIVRYSAARLSVFTFLAPLFGVAAGHLVLNEPLRLLSRWQSLWLRAASSSSTGPGDAICRGPGPFG
jgi:hypothetical protein